MNGLKNIYLLGTQAFTESLKGHEGIKKNLSICRGMQMFCEGRKCFAFSRNTFARPCK